MEMTIALTALLMLGVVAGASAETSPHEGSARQRDVQLAPLGVNSGPAPLQSVTPTAPAPALSRVVVYAVGSTQYGGYEYTPQNAFITTGDHGGTALRVVVWEQGYSRSASRIAKMNGTQLPTPYLEQPLCGTGTSTPQACPFSGGTITGYLVYYNLDGYQVGLFSFQATSLVFPYSLRNTSISIR